jgi:hypothetical protein
MEIFRKEDSAADALSSMNGLLVCAFSRKEVLLLSLLPSHLDVSRRVMSGMDLSLS